MTDIYPGAWSIVINYISNPLVEDSDDEKRINKAENKALKMKKEKENRLAKNLEIISVLMLSAMLQTIKGKIAQKSNPASSMERSWSCKRWAYPFGDCYEYKENGNIWIRGRLKASIQFWNYIDASKFITNTIDSGYKISFYSLPKGIFPKNNKSALQKDKFVRGEIKDLMDAGLISEQYEVPFVTNPLSVSVNSSGKRRHIFDIKRSQ